MEKLASTLRALEAIIASEYPIADSKIRRHELKVDDARRYKEELTDIIELHQGEESRMFIVAKNTFERIIANSDFVEIEEMQFARVASVINYPSSKSQIYIWLTPVTEL